MPSTSSNLSSAASPKSKGSQKSGSSKSRESHSSPSQPNTFALISSSNVFLFLVAFRILNAVCVRTFFQPDEFFQSLEPAWQTVFGKDSGAWITWVRGLSGCNLIRSFQMLTEYCFITVGMATPLAVFNSSIYIRFRILYIQYNR